MNKYKPESYQHISTMSTHMEKELGRTKWIVLKTK